MRGKKKTQLKEMQIYERNFHTNNRILTESTTFTSMGKIEYLDKESLEIFDVTFFEST